ncbi:MAG TPA: hypothetical protein VMZ53_28375 [Kofleriaceae bacterium]|nr:hypothetical protein [Kofleriaceae bacterium]
MTFPRRLLPLLHELGTRLLESRKPRTELAHLARDLMRGFAALCTRYGFDALLPLTEDPAREAALTTQLATADIDGGGPRNARPLKLAECLIAALGIELVDEPDKTITLDGTVRKDVVSTISKVVEEELAVPKLRDAIIAKARSKIEEQYFIPFQKISAELDERGMRITKQLKLPLDAVRAVQRSLDDARNGLLEAMTRTAIDRAKAVIARANPEAAERIDQPVTHVLTPRDATVARVIDPRLPKLPSSVTDAIVDGLGELASISWRADEKPVRPYSPKDTYKVGELIEHPKFGRGTVTAVSNSMPRVDIELADGKVITLVHVRK